MATLTAHAGSNELSLDALLNLEVVTASRTAQDIGWAPADMVVITRQQIEARGYRDLKDVFRDLPGFDISENVEGEVRTLVVGRGILGNNKIMVLRDGRKLNSNTGERFLYGNNIPLFNVERVEVVYGPASAMYGADAYSGVVNIITRTGEDARGLHATAIVGTNATFDEDVSAGFQAGEAEVYLGFRRFDSAGEDPTEQFSEDYAWYNENIGEFSQPTHNYNVFADVLVGELRIGFERADATEPNGFSTNPGEGWFTMDETYVWRQVTNRVYMEHAKTLGKVDLASTLEYSNYEVKPESNFHYQWGYQYKYAFNNAVTWEERANIYLTDKLTLNTGIMGQSIVSFPKTANLNEPFDPSMLVDDMSAWYVDGRVFGMDELEGAPAFGARPFLKGGIYAEGSYRISEQLQVNLGSRFDVASNYQPANPYDLINPRAGVIWRPGRSTLKVMYGESYIQPSEYDRWENFVAGDFLAHIPNPGLEAETLRSIQLAGDTLIGERTSVHVGLYHNELDAIIRPVAYAESNAWIENNMIEDAFIETNGNSGSQTTQGGELMARYILPSVETYGAVSVVRAVEEDGSPISKISPLKAHLGSTVYFLDRLSASARGRYYSAASAITPDGVQTGQIPARWFVDANLRMSGLGPIDLFINAQNITNNTAYGPTPFGEGESGWLMEAAPQPGLNVQGGLTLHL